MTSLSFTELSDVDYTRLRRRLLRTKGGKHQIEFLKVVRNSNDFNAYMAEIPVIGSFDIPLSPDPMTEDEFKAPPMDTENRLYRSWGKLKHRTACRSTFWTYLTCLHIEGHKIESSYLASNGGVFRSGAERIDRVLQLGEDVNQYIAIDTCVRTVLRRMGGIPEARGNRTVYVDTPFGRAWWREHLVAQIANGDLTLAEQIRHIIRIHQTYWEKIIQLIVSRNSTFGSVQVRNAFVIALAQEIAENPESELRKTKELERACRRVAVHQGTRELSILNDVEINDVMRSVLN